MKEINKHAGMIFGCAKEYYSEEDGDYMISEISQLESKNRKLNAEIESYKRVVTELTLEKYMAESERDEARISVCRLTSRLNAELGAETLSPNPDATGTLSRLVNKERSK